MIVINHADELQLQIVVSDGIKVVFQVSLPTQQDPVGLKGLRYSK